MTQVRYLDLVLGDTEDPAMGRTDMRFGLFVALSEPMPVGTSVSLDGVPHRITRVDEGPSPGFWVRAEGAPQPVDEQATVRTPTTAAAPEVISAQIAAVEAAPVAAAAPTTPAPSAAAAGAALAAAAAPTPPEDSEGGGKKRRRRAKTTMGR